MRFARNALLAVALAALASAIALAIGIIATDDDESGGTTILELPDDDPLTVATYRLRGDAPLVGEHWHVIYAIFVGNVRLPPAPTWEGSGVHTHGDGIIHIHPFTDQEEGTGASLAMWFEYGGGVLTDASLRVPGDTHTYLKGNSVVGDGLPGEIYVIQSSGGCDSRELAGQWVRVPTNYVPHDGDCIRVMFQSEQGMRELIKDPPSVPTPVLIEQ